MIVEFIGAAGVGKTYQADCLISLLAQKGVAAQPFPAIRIDRRSARNLIDMARAGCLSLITKPVNWERFLSSTKVIGIYAIRRRICRTNGIVGVTSEGLFHQIITIARRSRGLSAGQVADTLFAAIEPPDIVVLLDAPPETVYARRSARNRANDVFDFDSVRQDLEEAREMARVIEGVRAGRKSDMELIVMYAGATGGEELALQIASRVATIAERRGMRVGVQSAGPG